MSLLGNLFVRLSLEDQGFRRALQRADSDLSRFRNTTQAASTSVGGFASSLTNVVGVFGGLLIARTIGHTAVEMLRLAGAMEQAQAAFTHFLGSAQAANLFLKQLQDFAAKTPFEFPELLVATRRLNAYGFAAQEVIPILTTVGDHVAAIGAGKEYIDRITVALGQMRQAGRVNSQDMRQLTEAGVASWRFLAEASGKSIEEIRKLSEKGAIDSASAIKIILAGMATETGGMMESASQRMTGLYSTLVDYTRFLATDIGQVALPAVSIGIQFLTDAVMEARIELEKQKPAIDLISEAWVGALGVAILYATVVKKNWEAWRILPTQGTASLEISPKLRAEMQVAATIARIKKLQEEARKALATLFREPDDKKQKALHLDIDMDEMEEARERMAAWDKTKAEATMRELQFNDVLKSGVFVLQGFNAEAAFSGPLWKVWGDTIKSNTFLLNGFNATAADSAAILIDVERRLEEFKIENKSTEALRELEEAADVAGAANKKLAQYVLEVQRAVEAGTRPVTDYFRAQELYSKATQKAAKASKDWADIIKRQVSTVITDLSRNIVDLIFAVDKTKKIDKAAEDAERIFDVLRQGAEDLAKRGYSQPVAALQNFIDRIRAASSDAEATQIAIRAFGESAGVQMAAQIRHGAVSIEEMMKRLREGFPLIENFRKQLDETGKSGNRIVGIFVEIAKGFARMSIEAVFHSKTVQKAMGAILDRLAGLLKSIPLISNALKRLAGEVASGAAGQVAGQAVGVAGGAAQAAGGAAQAAGGVAGAAGSAGSAAAGAGITGIVGAVAGVVSAISGVIGNFQMAGMNKSLDLIEKATRYSESHLLNLIGQMQTHLPQISANTLAAAYGAVPALLAQINDAIRIDLISRINELRLATAGSSGGTGGAGAMSITITGNNFYGPANNPTTVSDLMSKIVRELLARGVRPGP